MLNSQFERFYKEALLPSRKSTEPPTVKPPTPDHISEEAKLFLAALEGPIERPDYHDPTLRKAFRSLLMGTWERAAQFIEVPVEFKERYFGGIRCGIFSPEKNRAPHQKLLYLHGGAYWVGSPEANSAMGKKMAHASGRDIISVDYRLAPENPHPAAREDALAAYQTLLKEGTKPSDIAIFGDSAGGGLCLTLALELKRLKLPQPAAIGLVCPWTDLQLDGDSYKTLSGHADPFLTVNGLRPAAAGYAGDTDISTQEINPHRADLTDLPPMIIHAGTREVFLSDAIRLARQARDCGVSAHFEIYDGMWHVWHVYPGVPEGDKAILEIAAFLCDHMD